MEPASCQATIQVGEKKGDGKGGGARSKSFAEERDSRSSCPKPEKSKERRPPRRESQGKVEVDIEGQDQVSPPRGTERRPPGLGYSKS